MTATLSDGTVVHIDEQEIKALILKDFLRDGSLKKYIMRIIDDDFTRNGSLARTIRSELFLKQFARK